MSPYAAVECAIDAQKLASTGTATSAPAAPSAAQVLGPATPKVSPAHPGAMKPVLRSASSARALCLLDAAERAQGRSRPPAAAAVTTPAPLATPFDAQRAPPPCAKAAPEDQRTPLATWPSESDGSEWLASAASAEARAEAPPGAGKAAAVRGAGVPAALASAGSVQWIINDWDAYDAAWESAYAYLSDEGADDDDDWDCESDDDGCVGGGARVGSGQRRAPSPARAQDVLLPWDT